MVSFVFSIFYKIKFGILFSFSFKRFIFYRTLSVLSLLTYPEVSGFNLLSRGNQLKVTLVIYNSENY